MCFGIIYHFAADFVKNTLLITYSDVAWKGSCFGATAFLSL